MVRLIIEGQECDVNPSEIIKFTRQVNDLRDPSGNRLDGSNIITLPFTDQNKKIFHHANILSVVSDVPYKDLDAIVYVDNLEFTVNAKVSLIKVVEKGYKVQVRSGFSSVYDNLKDTPLSDLDLSEFSHYLTLDEVVNRNESRQDVFYPLFNDGYGLEETVNIGHLVPFIKTDVLVRKIFELQGFEIEGDFIDSDVLQNSIIALNGNLSKDAYINAYPPVVGGDGSVYDLLKSLMQLTNSYIVTTDYLQKKIKIDNFQDLKTNTPYDWSNKVNSEKGIPINFETNEVGKKSIFTYENEEDETVGMFEMSIDNSKLKAEKKIIESKIKALNNSNDIDLIYFFDSKSDVEGNLEKEIGLSESEMEEKRKEYRTGFNTDDLIVTSLLVNESSKTFTPLESKYDVTSINVDKNYEAVTYDGTYLYLAKDKILYRYSFNETTYEIDLIDYHEFDRNILDIDVENQIIYLMLEGDLINYHDGVTRYDANVHSIIKTVDISKGLNQLKYLDQVNLRDIDNSKERDFHYFFVYSLCVVNRVMYVTRSWAFQDYEGVITAFDVSKGLINANYLNHEPVVRFMKYDLKAPITADSENAYMIIPYFGGKAFGYSQYKIDNDLKNLNLLVESDNSFSEIENQINSIKIYGSLMFIIGDNTKQIHIKRITNDFIEIPSQTDTSYPYCNFTPLHWETLTNKYYNSWKDVFEAYKEINVKVSLTSQEVKNHDFSRPVNISNKYGSALYYVNKIEGFVKGKQTKCTLIKL